MTPKRAIAVMSITDARLCRISSRVSAAANAERLRPCLRMAAAETRLLIRQSLASVMLITAMALFGVIAYVALIGAGVSLLAVKLSWGWPVSLAAAGMIHLALLGIAYAFLKNRAPVRPYEATSAEIRRDIETLSGNLPRSGQ